MAPAASDLKETVGLKMQERATILCLIWLGNVALSVGCVRLIIGVCLGDARYRQLLSAIILCVVGILLLNAGIGLLLRPI